LTATDPAIVRRRLADAFEIFADGMREGSSPATNNNDGAPAQASFV
jgi:hypothetical protein